MANFHKTVPLESGVMRKCHAPFGGGQKEKQMMLLAGCLPYVVHHALCQVIEPIFERTFIHDSYACRIGKGNHRALERCSQFARRYAYVLKGDIVKYFPSIDHAILRAALSRRIADENTLGLIDLILTSGAGVQASEYTMQWFPGDDLLAACRERGLPIGNLTSQFWANVYLDPLDQFVKRTLHGQAYLRYSDDFLLFHDDKRVLQDWREAIREFLQTLRLRLHEGKSDIFPVRLGVTFVGFRVFPTYRRLRRDNVRRAYRRMRDLQAAYRAGTISQEQASASVRSWIAHSQYAATYGLRRQLVTQFAFSHSPRRRKTQRRQLGTP